MNNDENGISVSRDDVAAMRRALVRWGKPASVVEGFTQDRMSYYLDRWELFVRTDWEAWDPAEYSHDIGVRYFIQLAIETMSPSTRAMLEEAVSAADQLFRSKMVPAKPVTFRNPSAAFREAPYFWEENTLHPYYAL